MVEVAGPELPHEPGAEASARFDSTSALSTSMARMNVEADTISDKPEDEDKDAGDGGPEDDEDDDDEDDDRYRLFSAPEKLRKMSEKKRLETAAFQSWIEKNQREISNTNATKLERQSVAHLFEGSWTSKIISSPREYQIDLFERAKKKNTIVVLDTGRPGFNSVTP